MRTKYRHRVDRVREPQAPPALPKEAVITGPRTLYVPRTGREYDVVWCGAKTDPDLCDMTPTIWK
jgi:hypothetical protein